MSLRFIRVLPKTNRQKLAFIQTMQLPFASRDAKHREKIHETSLRFTNENAPIFILGHFRSGTTYLHNILCQNSSSLYPTLHTILNQNSYISGDGILRFLWHRTFPNIWKTGTRKFDHVALSLDSPAEDEIVTYKGPVAGPFSRDMWHYNSKYQMYDESNWQNDYQHMLQKLIYYNQFIKKTDSISNPRLVLKAPSHLTKIPILLDLFPNAKFIHIHRNPVDVIQSYTNLLKYDDGINDIDQNENGLDANAIDINQNDLYIERAIDTYNRLMKSLIFEVDINRVFDNKPDQFTEIRYDDLMIDPINTLKQSFDNLNVTDLMCPEINEYIENEQSTHIKNEYPPFTEEQKRRIEMELSFAFTRWNYNNNDIPQSNQNKFDFECN